MAKVTLPEIVFAHERRPNIVGLSLVALCLLTNLLYAVVVRWTTSFVPLLFLPLPYLVLLGYEVRRYAWRRRLRRRVFDKERLKGQPCEHCLYDCTGNVSGKCPECGSDIPVDLAERWQNWRRTSWLVRLRGRNADDAPVESE